MQAVLTVSRIAKKDAIEAFKLYFEPLLKVLTWLRSRASDTLGKKHRDQLLASIESLESTGRSLEPLALSPQLKDDELWKAIFIHEGPLVLLRPEFPPLQLGSRRVGSVFALLDAKIQEGWRIQKLSADASLAATIGLFASMENASDSAVHSATSLRSLRALLDSDTGEIRLLSGSGDASFLGRLLRSEQSPEESQYLPESIEQTHFLEVGGQSLKRFGIYLEVAAFLAQEGYEEAAVAVVTQAFKLLRPGHLVNPGKERE